MADVVLPPEVLAALELIKDDTAALETVSRRASKRAQRQRAGNVLGLRNEVIQTLERISTWEKQTDRVLKAATDPDDAELHRITNAILGQVRSSAGNFNAILRLVAELDSLLTAALPVEP